MGRRRISTRMKEKDGDWTWPIGRRYRWSWRSIVIPSMTSNQVSIISAMAKWRQTQWMFRTPWLSGVRRVGSSPLRYADNFPMELLKKAVTVKGKAIYDVETLFSRLLVRVQQRSIDRADVF